MLKFIRLALVISLSLLASAQPPDKLQSVSIQQDKPEKSAPVLVKPNLNQSETDFLNDAYRATVLLYRQDDGGSLRPTCTATAILKYEAGYIFLTAAHCVNDKYIYYITDDVETPKAFEEVNGMICGDRAEGLDFCFLRVPTTRQIPIMALGVEPNGIGGEAVAAISSPLGLGKQVFRGSVATAHMKRPVLLRDDSDRVVGNWYDYILLQMQGINSMSSGSALLCTGQRAMCGVIVGTMATPTGNEAVAVPINMIVEQMIRHGIATRTPKPKK